MIIGSSLLYQYFRVNSGTAFGIFESCTGMGIAVGGPVGAFFVDKYGIKGPFAFYAAM